MPEMTVAAHAPSNSIVITAPDSLFAEVQALVRSVDTMSEQVVEVLPTSGGIDIESVLQTLNIDSGSSSNRRSSSGRSRSSNRRR